MKGTIVHYRRGVTTQKTNQMVIMAQGVSDKDKAASLVGKTVVWKSPANKEIKGTISAPHGSKGAVRAVFERGMPGQSISQTVEIK